MSTPVAPPYNACLHRFAVLTALATLGLVGVGGLVTSHGAGMAVPDWPNTYGYNMFFFPISQWVGGIFYEHTHRLVASAVGLLTVVLALWLYGRGARGVHAVGGRGAAAARSRDSGWRCPTDGRMAWCLGLTGLALFGASWFGRAASRAPNGCGWLGLVAFIAVVLQGVLGGLRVVLFKDADRDLSRHAGAAVLCAWSARLPSSPAAGGSRNAAGKHGRPAPGAQPSGCRTLGQGECGRKPRAAAGFRASAA